jgi:hypothetical protein
LCWLEEGVEEGDVTGLFGFCWLSFDGCCCGWVVGAAAGVEAGADVVEADAVGADIGGVCFCTTGVAVADVRFRVSASSFVRAIFVSSSMCFWKNSS